MNRAFFILFYAVVAGMVQQGEESSRLRLARGAFSDALKSARAITDSSERDYAVSEIAKAQARSALITEAIGTTASAGEVREMALVDVAIIAANRGNYELAMKAVQGESRFTQDRVREEIGLEQARRGDVGAALMTADAMHDGYAKESVVYFACLELLRQGDRGKAEQLGHGLKSSDHILPKESEIDPTFDWRKPSPPPKPTDWLEARCNPPSLLQAGKIEEAVSCVESRPNPADVASDLAWLAEKAAELGNLDAALRIANDPHLSGTQYEAMYLAGALGRIGRVWAGVDISAALKWAETRPSAYQRALALAGFAEGVAASEQPLP